MSNYQAGTLDIAIQTISGDTLKSLDAVIKRLNTIQKGLKGIKDISEGGTGSGGGSGGKGGKKPKKDTVDIGGGKGKNKGGLFNLAKMTGVLVVAKRLGNVVADIAQSGADYVETLNLWRVSMGDFAEQGEVFVNKMNEAYGISEKTLMNAQATYKNMLSALGNISNEMAYNLSEAVTKMSIDYASLYNVSIEQATQKFQAALAGQVRPIRSVSGYDITEGTLYQLYQSLGGTKTIRQLNQTEKRLLSIYAIFNQMEGTGAIKDMDRTINSFANQSRVMAETFAEVQQYSGILLTNMLSTFNVLPTVNAVLSYMAEVLKAIATISNSIEMDDIFAGIEENAKDASKSIDEVKGKLLGFDKFRSLQGTEEDDVDIDSALAGALGNYGKDIDTNLMAATEMSRGWLEAIGLIYDAEKGTYNVTEKFKAFAEIFKVVGASLAGVVAVLGAKGIMGLLAKLSPLISNIGTGLKGAFSLKNIGIMALVGALYYMYTTNEEFRESVDNLISVLFDALGNVMQPISDLITAIAPIIATILTVVAEIAAPLINVISEVIKFLDQTGLLKAALAAIAIAIGVITIAVWANNAAWLANPVTWIIAAIIAAVVVLGIVISSVIENIDAIWETIKGLGSAIVNFFAGLIEGVVNLVITAVNVVADFINLLISPLSAITEALGWGKIEIPDITWRLDIPTVAFAEGGMPDKGTMFVAGEAGAEIVYNNPNGQSGVANIQQIAQATYQGTMKALSDWWGGTGAKGDIPQFEQVGPTGLYQTVTGVAKSYGNRWDTY